MLLLFSHKVLSDSATLWATAHQLPCTSLSPGVCSDSSPFSQLMPCNHLILCRRLLLLSSVFPSITGSFPMNWLFTSDGQSIGTLVSTSVLPVNIQGLFPLALTGLIFLLSKGFSRVFSSTTVQKHQFFSDQPFL